MARDEPLASLPALSQPISRIIRVNPENPRRRVTASAVRWTLLGILGLALAVGVALVASSLASQRIGLSDEPISAGSALQPPRSGDNSTTRPGDETHSKGTTPTPSDTTGPGTTTIPVSPTTTTSPPTSSPSTSPPAAPTATTPAPPDIHGDDGGQSHGGGSGDD